MSQNILSESRSQWSEDARQSVDLKQVQVAPYLGWETWGKWHQKHYHYYQECGCDEGEGKQEWREETLLFGQGMEATAKRSLVTNKQMDACLASSAFPSSTV